MWIKEAKARKIFNSLGQEIVEIEIKGDNGNVGIGSCDVGLSKSSFEVNSFPEKGVDHVIDKFNSSIGKQMINLKVMDFDDLEEVEKLFRIYDITNNLADIGGNIIISTEYAILRALSENGNVAKFLNPNKDKFPAVLINIVGGGKHSLGRGPDFQEFIVIPKTKDIIKAVEAAIEIDKIMEDEIGKRDKEFNKKRNLKGALSPNMLNLEILSLLHKFSNKVAREKKIRISLGLDVAANYLWNGRKYEYKKFSKLESKRNLSREEHIEFISKVISNYKLDYIEDPFEENDFEGFRELNKGLGIIAGDDIISTRIDRLKENEKKISAVIIKPDQIGSLVKTKELIDYCFKNKIMPILSHRTGASNDSIISHLAVGWELPMIKLGLIGGERINRLNELIKIKENLQSNLIG